MRPNKLFALVRQNWIPVVEKVHGDESDVPKVNPQCLHDKNFNTETKEVSVPNVPSKLELVHQGNEMLAVGKLLIWIG